MQRIVKRKLFRIEFALASALSVGSGENLSTDRDIILGSDNKPYIPASTIAGVCINFMDKERKYKDYWGFIKKAEDQDSDVMAMESRIIFYDACLIPEQNAKPIVSIRDSVALDEYKTAIIGAKFDMEVLEPGIRFRTYIEQLFMSDEEPDLSTAIAECFTKGDLFFGGKTSRGYGAIDDVEAKEYELRFDDNSPKNLSSISAWARGTLEDLNWKELKLDLKTKKERIIIDLEQVGGISIRQYTTEVANKKGESAPDFTQLLSSDVDDQGNQIYKPVIPGTTWAGAFEHQTRKNMGEDFNKDEWNRLFGYVSDSKKQKSKIRFGESLIEGATGKQLSRNAIDRFSGGTVDGALFTEKTFYGGTTQLVIGISDDVDIPDKLARAITATILDLHYGFMAIGGETSIGRGMFRVTAIDGEKIPEKIEQNEVDKFYIMVYKKITGNNRRGDQSI